MTTEHPLLLKPEYAVSEAYALALGLTHCETAAPLSIRMAWASFLRRYEPDPDEVRRAVLKAHENGHMQAGILTPDGVLAALEAFRSLDLPPPSIDQPQNGGEVVTCGKP